MGGSRMMKQWTYAFGGMILASGVVVGLGLYAALERLPSHTEVQKQYQVSEMLLVDSEGQPLHRWRQDLQKKALSWTSLPEVSPSLVQAVLKSEDRQFYDHHGVDLKALGASLYQRWTENSPRGGSTISMQTVKLITPHRKKYEGWWGKVRQAVTAYYLETQWSKTQILEAYLNLVTFRGENRGIASAAEALFSKRPRGLTLKESTLLAVLIRSPNAPLQAWSQRACWQEWALCKEMHAWIYQNARRPAGNIAEQKALHLAQRLASSGLKGEIKTTIRSDVQNLAQNTLRSQIRGLQERNVHDAAVLVIENKTGEVWAYIGGPGLDPETRYVDGIQAFRQAGSTLKPFLYATAFERELLSPESWIEDSAVDIVFERGVYKPQNHDRKFYGWVQAKTALGSSLNVPAVKVFKLLNDTTFWSKLKALRFQNLLEPEHYGPALALGVADVRLEDLTQAYRTLANKGVYSGLIFTSGEVTETERVFSEKSANLVSSVLAASENRALGFGLESALSLPGVAVKTGTSKDMRDNWCVGYNDRFTVGVWVGNFSGTPMWNVLGVTGAAPIWRNVMEFLERKYPAEKPLPDIKTVPLAAGSEPQNYPKARIIYPQNGMVLALDPAIPKHNQKMPLIAESVGDGRVEWKINGVKKAASRSGGTFLWTPTQGRHRFELLKNGQTAQSVEVIVK